ncbi:MAG: twin-arginine translocase TatA/TatE family subunit [Alphaproteobacteria bacterium]
MFGLGATELVVVLVLVVLLFGVGRIGNVMKEMGKGVTAFKTGLNEGAEQPTKSGIKKPKTRAKAGKK